MRTLTERFRKLSPAFTFAGFTFPRYIPLLPKGDFKKRLERNKRPVVGPYYHQPAPLKAGDNGKSFYLESDFMPGLRWSWCDEIPGDWDENECPPNIKHTGWFIDMDQLETVRGIVFKLPGNRGFLAGWSMGEGMASGIESFIYSDINSAGYAADSIAEHIADSNREQEKYEREVG